MHVAVTGATGFIGSKICERLAAGGHGVVALVRETSRTDHIEPYCERMVTGDHADESVWPELLAGADAVIHGSVDWTSLREAAEHPTGTRDHLMSNIVGSIRLLEASAPRPFVFLSSVAVHHDILPRWDHAPDEDHPLRPSSSYGAYKAAVEPHLWAEHFSSGRHTAAIRPSAVYGIDPKLDRSIAYRVVRGLIETGRCEKPGGGKFVHVDDVAETTAAALEKPGASGQPFHLADCYARWSDFAKMAAEILGIEAEIDASSPPTSKNFFDKTRTKALSERIDLERGHGGLRAYLEALIAEMSRRGLTTP